VEIAQGDSHDAGAMARACEGVDIAYFLMHSLQSKGGFSSSERSMALTFSVAARNAGLSRIVYLGGLIPPVDPDELSEHLESRGEVGEILRASGVPCVELRAAVILGSGSASFEMLRYLTERLPAMVTPKWVRNRIQPIAIRDVLGYLVGAADVPLEVNRAFDIGGPEVMTYLEMMQRYASVAGLPRRIIVPVPVLTPTLSSHWVGVVTPVPATIARPLVESLRHEVVCAEKDIEAYIPDPPGGLTTFDRSIALALKRVKDADVATRWSSASTPGAPAEPLPTDPDWSGGSLYTDVRSKTSEVTPASLWRVIEGVGGDNGWYSFPLAWEIRGWMDRAVGGVGLRRGRRSPKTLMVGEAVDFWRVEEVVPEKLLRLRAEMKMPGLAWLEFTVSIDEHAKTVYGQRATFFPRGLAGHAYWWAVFPAHGIVFGSMLRNITKRAAQLDRIELENAAIAALPGEIGRPVTEKTAAQRD